MDIPPELAWLVPVILPFILGLLVGVLIRVAVKLIIVVVALVAILVVIGALNIDTINDLCNKAMEFLPRFYDIGRGWLNVLPYSSAAFLIGFVLGLLVAEKKTTI